MSHMPYQKFIETVKEHIKQATNRTVHVYPVLKNNGTQYDGLIIVDPVYNISPTLYLNPYYHRYLEGVSLEDIYDDILSTYHTNIAQTDFDITVFQDYEKARERVVLKLVNAERNKQLLEQVPHILFYDLAIVFLCNVSDCINEFATIMIYEKHLKHWNVTKEDLYHAALSNSPRLLPPRLDNLHDVFQEITSESLSFLKESNINILTNHLKIYGASCLLYPDLLSEIADIYNDDIVIIPSSIHEVLVFPHSHMPDDYDFSHLDAMIDEINEMEVPDNDILSSHAYLYHRDTKEISF